MVRAVFSCPNPPDQEINMLVTLSGGIPVAITALGAALATLLGVIL